MLWGSDTKHQLDSLYGMPDECFIRCKERERYAAENSLGSSFIFAIFQTMNAWTFTQVQLI